MKRKLIVLGVAIFTLTGIVTYNMYNSKNELCAVSNDLLANIEALAGIESSGKLECSGLLGLCKFKCTGPCGTDWSAIGSTMTNTHTCKRTD